MKKHVAQVSMLSKHVVYFNGSAWEMEPGKRKSKTNSFLTPQDTIEIKVDGYKLYDDVHSILHLGLWQRLRPIIADPTTWWMKGAILRVEKPVCGAHSRQNTLC